MDGMNKNFFVSSTFRDFQVERDLLHLHILPVLREKAASYGESVEFTDLRWGVNTADYDISEKSRRVLRVCLDEIDKSHPYLLIFLGDRYGWIPDGNEIQESLAQKGFSDVDTSGYSVTSMEINYGAILQQIPAEKCIICLRDSLSEDELGSYATDYLAENEEEKVLLEELKEQLIARFPKQIIHYQAKWDEEKHILTGLDDFRQKLQNKLFGILQPEWEKKSSRTIYEKEQDASWLAFYQRSRRFCGRSEELAMLEAENAEGSDSVVMVHGEENSGKSMLLGAYAVKLREDGARVFVMNCPGAVSVKTIEDMLDHRNAWVEKQLGITEHHNSLIREKETDLRTPEMRCKEYFKELMEQWGEREPLYFIMDGLDAIWPRFCTIPFWLTQPAAVHTIVSARKNLRFTSDDAMELVLETASEDNLRLQIEGRLRDAHKLVDKQVFEYILAKCSGKGALYTEILLTRLILFDSNDLKGCSSDEEINARICSVLNELSDDLEEVMVQLTEILKERIGAEFVQHCLDLLAISEHGLRAMDLEGIFRQQGWMWNAYSFALLYRYGDFLFVEREDGFIDYKIEGYRTSIKNAVDYDEIRNCRQLLDYLVTLGIKDPLRVRESFRCMYRLKDMDAAVHQIECVAVDFQEHVKDWIKEVIDGSKGYEKLPLLEKEVLDWLSEALDTHVLSENGCLWLAAVYHRKTLFYTKKDDEFAYYEDLRLQCLKERCRITPSVSAVHDVINVCRTLCLVWGVHIYLDLQDFTIPYYETELEYQTLLFEWGELEEKEYLQYKARLCSVLGLLYHYELWGSVHYGSKLWKEFTEQEVLEQALSYLSQVLDDVIPLLEERYHLSSEDYELGVGPCYPKITLDEIEKERENIVLKLRERGE